MKLGFLTDVEKKSYFKWLVLINVAMGTFMATLDSSIVNVALPTISHEFDVTKGTIQWVVTSYLLTISSVLLAFGRLADILGKNRIYGMGFLGFVVGSALCGFSATIEQLIIFRIIQAFGAAMMMANGMGLLVSVFPPQERGRALGLGGTTVALGSMTGPSLGGILVSSFGWRSIFYINIPIGILGFLASMFILPSDKDLEKNQTFDFVGAGLFCVGMILLLMGLSNVEHYGFLSPHVIYMVVSALAVLGLFLFFETKTKQPMIDVSLFRNSLFFRGNIAGFLSFVAMMFCLFLMPFYLQEVLKLPPNVVGLMMTPFPIAMAIVAPISGWLSDKVGFLYLTTGGLLVTTLGMGSFTFLHTDSTPWTVALRFALIGVGAGLFQSPNNSSIMGTVPPPKLGFAGGVVATVRNVGMVMGVAIAVALFNSRFNELEGLLGSSEAFVSSLHLVFKVGMALSLAGALISFSRGYFKKKEDEDERVLFN